jgi:hypothetical protein
VAQKDEAAARRRGGRARDRRLRCGRRRLDGNGAGDRARRAAGSRHAGGGEEEARGRGAGAGEQCGGKRRSWSSHLPEGVGLIWLLTWDVTASREERKEWIGELLSACCTTCFSCALDFADFISLLHALYSQKMIF